MKTGAELIAEERARQITQEGYDAQPDDGLDDGSIAAAASCYAIHAAMGSAAHYCSPCPPPWWPWGDEAWKPKGRLVDLVKAGALIAAEIDRMQREL